MAKEETKNIFEEYWKAFVEGIISSALIYAFMSINIGTFILGIIFISIDIYTLYYSAVELGDPKLLIVFLITEIFFGGSKDGK